MTRSQAVALFVALLAVASAGGVGWWLRAHHEVPAVAARLASLTSPQPPAVPTVPAQGPAIASRETPPPPTSAALGSPPQPSVGPAPATQAEAAQPSFDIVRVEPRGDSVVAGKGTPNAKVALMAGGKVVGETKADGNGQFVILPPPLPPGDYNLTLRQQPENGAPATESAQSVAVSVPKPGKGSIVVALAEPGKATKLLTGPPEAPTSAPLPPGKVAIRSAELENGTGFFVSGAATAGAQVHVYLNDAHIADVVAGADGAWSVRVKKGLTGGHYVVRADAGGAGRTVASRVEVPFDVPTAMAAAAAAPPSAAVASATPVSTPSPAVAGTTTTSGADAVLESLDTARVTTGDNLWNISRFRLGDGKRYTQIYAANSGQIRDPNLIYPGQVFVVPAR